jgi:hypothetical protein
MYAFLNKKPALSCIVFSLLSSAGLCQSIEASANDSARTDTFLTALENFDVSPDSVMQSVVSNHWLLPVGVIAATGAAIYLLFSVRSR